jgi:hypothetical protein
MNEPFTESAINKTSAIRDRRTLRMFAASCRSRRQLGKLTYSFFSSPFVSHAASKRSRTMRALFVSLPLMAPSS